MDYSQIIIKHGGILDVIFIGTKYITKLWIILTKFDAEFPEKELSFEWLTNNQWLRIVY